MTNRDPYENPNLGRPATEGLGTGTIAALVIVAILVVGGVIYGMTSDRSSSTATAPRTTTSAPSTTGQSDTTRRPETPPVKQ
jgi:hypothetical protein